MRPKRDVASVASTPEVVERRRDVCRMKASVETRRGLKRVWRILDIMYYCKGWVVRWIVDVKWEVLICETSSFLMQVERGGDYRVQIFIDKGAWTLE